MRLLFNLFFLASQLSLTSCLRVIDNGLGPPVYGSEETNVDFALLAADTKASLPNQVQATSHFWWFTFFSVHHLLVCNFSCFVNRPLLLSTSPPVSESLDLTVYASRERGKHNQINGNVTSRFKSEIWKSIWLKPFEQGCQRGIWYASTCLELSCMHIVYGERSFQHHTPSQVSFTIPTKPNHHPQEPGSVSVATPYTNTSMLSW